MCIGHSIAPLLLRLQQFDRLPSVGDVIDRVLGLAARADYAKQPCRTN